jgi:hypothetical protein
MPSLAPLTMSPRVLGSCLESRTGDLGNWSGESCPESCLVLQPVRGLHFALDADGKISHHPRMCGMVRPHPGALSQLSCPLERVSVNSSKI